MLVDKDDLWYRVLKARYGEEGGRLKVGGNVEAKSLINFKDNKPL